MIVDGKIGMVQRAGFKNSIKIIAMLAICICMLAIGKVSAAEIGTDFTTKDIDARSKAEYIQSYQVRSIPERVIKRRSLESFDVSRDGKLIAVSFSGNEIGIYDDEGKWLRGIKVLGVWGAVDCELDDEDDKLLLLYHRSNIMYKVDEKFAVEDAVYFSEEIDVQRDKFPSVGLHGDKVRGDYHYKMSRARLTKEANGKKSVLIDHSLWVNVRLLVVVLLFALPLLLSRYCKKLNKQIALAGEKENEGKNNTDDAGLGEMRSGKLYFRKEKMDYPQIISLTFIGLVLFLAFYDVTGIWKLPLGALICMCVSTYTDIRGRVKRENALIHSGELIWCEVDYFTVDEKKLAILVHVKDASADGKVVHWYRGVACGILSRDRWQVMQTLKAKKYLPVFAEPANHAKYVLADYRRQYTEAEYQALEDSSEVIREIQNENAIS